MSGRSAYGHFDDHAAEYVICRPDTPLPWINYLGCEDYFAILSNTAGGYSFYRDARLRRLTRYRYNSVPLDSNGRYVYVRDGDAVWNPGWKPTRTALEAYECRHGLGYTRISGQRGGLEVSVLHFVPLGFTAEVWQVRARNLSDAPKRVSLWGFVEWCLWDAMDDMTNFQRNFSIGEVEVEDRAIFHVTEYRERRNHFAFLWCSRETTGFDTARDAFIGVHEGLDSPRAVTAGRCTGSVANGWAPIAAHQVDLDLPPGGEETFHFLLGYAENPPESKFSAPGVANKAPFHAVREALATEEQVRAAFGRLGDHWRELLSVYQVEIEDPDVRRMVNVWNPYQCMATLNLSRSASLYESGIGRGMGFRDSNQDLLGVVHLQPTRSRQRLLDLAATQRSDGTCFHQYQPLTRKGNESAGSGFNDDPLWLVLAASAYVNETGDLAVLDARVGSADEPGAPTTLLDHLELSIAYTLRNLGPHGLPLIGHADWNDCLNLNCFSMEPGESFQLAGDVEGPKARVAESVMIAGLFCVAAERLAEIYRQRGNQPRAEELVAHRRRMQQTVERHGWGGEWFLRAYDAFGRKVGSRECDEGQIFTEPQGWCILGGIGLDDGKAARAMESVAKRLATRDGIILQQPAYATYHAHLGEISSYPPGYKENAGIFTHNNTWIQIAHCLLGDGNRAFDYYQRICPCRKEARIETYRAEPYVYSQMTAGPDAATPGEAKNSWLTGTAAWSFVAISQYILGVRPSPQGLIVDPCIPRAWREYTVRRRFRGATYVIHVRNPNGVSRGVRRMIVNGQQVAPPVIPPAAEAGEVGVEVEMG